MSRTSITCRFRKDLDADLINAIKALNEGELSELTRNGLRLMLGIRTTKQIEVKERPLMIPPAAVGICSQVTPLVPGEQKEKTAIPQSRPAVLLNKNIRPNS